MTALVVLPSCSGESLTDDDDAPVDTPLATPLDSSVAPGSRVRMFIGQDVASIRDYASAVQAPAGVVGYTSLSRLEGVHEEVQTGGGLSHLDGLVAEYPGMPVALGLYLVNMLDDVNAGDLDANIAELGQALGAYGVPVLLRVGYEFDGSWAQYEPDEYISAFVRIADGVRSEGADNVEFVWQSAGLCDTYGGHPQDAWYPGDDHVDWVSTSLFAPVDGCGLNPQNALIRFAREHEKPFFIAEATPKGFDLADLTYSTTGTTRDAVTADVVYDRWFSHYFGFIHDHLDVIRAVTYINADWDSQDMWGPPYDNGYWGDSRVQANPDILSRWQDELGGSIWVGDAL